MINISICLSDLPKEKIVNHSNGKKYINITVDNRKEKDQYDNTHTVYISRSKEDRENKEPKIYVGNGREFIFNNNTQPPKQSDLPEEDILPW